MTLKEKRSVGQRDRQRGGERERLEGGERIHRAEKSVKKENADKDHKRNKTILFKTYRLIEDQNGYANETKETDVLYETCSKLSTNRLK